MVAQFLKDEVAVGVDAEFGGDLHGLGGDLAGSEFAVAKEDPGRREGEVAAGADGYGPVGGFDDGTGARDKKGLLGVAD